jgi:hypothetical protein
MQYLVSSRSVCCHTWHRLRAESVRTQKRWKFASAVRNVDTLWFRKLCCQNAAFSETWNTSAALLHSEMVGVIGLWWPWTLTGGGGVVRCRTTALLVVKLAVTLLQLSYRAACSNTQQLAVTLFQLSHRAACSNTQQLAVTLLQLSHCCSCHTVPPVVTLNS